MAYEVERDAAVEAVLEAGRMCQLVQSEMLHTYTMSKSDNSPVTVADFGAQALICRSIASRFPDDPIVAEEGSNDLTSGENNELLCQITRYVQRYHPASSDEICSWIDLGGGAGEDRFWTLDPLDGTRGFLRGDQYAVALALVVNAEVVVGAMACPSLPHDLDNPDGDRGVIFWTVRHEGWSAVSMASLSPLEPATGTIPSSRLIQSLESSTSHHALQEMIAGQLQLAAPPLKMDSQAKYAAVARGDAALYLRLRSPSSPDYCENIWDHAAGVLLVTESGGKVTDSLGQPLDFTAGRKLTRNVGIVASNGVDHEAVIQLIDSAYSTT